ncbi:MAG: phosphoglycerate kinase, partial [Phycisphaerae bacterium]
MSKKLIDDVGVEGRRILMRVDFNVPLENGAIKDDRRVTQALESIRSVIERGGRLILMSHLGRPKGAVRAELSLEPVARHLAGLLGKPVSFAADCVGDTADRAVSALEPGGVLLLENLRFHAAETLIDKAKRNPGGRPTPDQRARIDAFAAALASHGDLYCNNAFGTCHRRHVSMYDVPMRLGPGRRVCGHLVERELRFLGEALSNPARPFVAILGGAKVSDKIGVIENLLPKVDHILIGGAMAYTFLASQGVEIGASLCERDKLDLAAGLLEKAGGKIHLPGDHVCAAGIQADAEAKTLAGRIDPGLMGLDIGPETVRQFTDTIRAARTVVWNGPVGVFETPGFDHGTLAIARALAEVGGRGATTIIGGGDSAAAV